MTDTSCVCVYSLGQADSLYFKMDYDKMDYAIKIKTNLTYNKTCFTAKLINKNQQNEQDVEQTQVYSSYINL